MYMCSKYVYIYIYICIYIYIYICICVCVSSFLFLPESPGLGIYVLLMVGLLSRASLSREPAVLAAGALVPLGLGYLRFSAGLRCFAGPKSRSLTGESIGHGPKTR